MKDHRIALTVVIFVLISRSFAVDANTEWKVQVQGIGVVAIAADGKKTENTEAELFMHRGTPGVTVVLQLTAPAGNIVGVNADESKIDSFTDDQGTDLMKRSTNSSFSAESGIFARLGFGPLVEGKPSTLVRVSAPGQAAKKATRFSLTANVAVLTASQTNHLIAENVNLATNTAFKLGDLELKISSLRSQAEKLEVYFHSKQDLSSIASLTFYDEKGDKIESDVGSSYLSSYRHDSGKEKQWTLGFRLEKVTTRVTVEAACWTDLKAVKVPIAVKAGVGL